MQGHQFIKYIFESVPILVFPLNPNIYQAILVRKTVSETIITYIQLSGDEYNKEKQMETVKTPTRMVDKIEEWKKDQEKNPYISRNDYLKSLSKDEYGNPIIDKQEFWKLSRLHNWEEDFLQSAISAGIVEAEGIPEYFMDTSEYGV